jgi:hypothetical protein
VEDIAPSVPKEDLRIVRKKIKAIVGRERLPVVHL